MAIERIKVSNFRSFKELDLELGPLTVLIGPNASGKSNLVQLFKFLRDIAREGLGNALSLQGGPGYLRNLKIGAASNVAFEIRSKQEGNLLFQPIEQENVGTLQASVHQIIYQFALKFEEKAEEVEIVEDKLTLECHFIERLESQIKGKQLGSGELVISHANGRIDIEASIGEHILKDWRFPVPLPGQYPVRALLYEMSVFPLAPFLSVSLAKPGDLRLSIYDFNPKGIKTSAPLAGKSELEEDGSNLAIVLKKIMDNKEDKRAFLNLLKDMLSFADDLAVERGLNNALRFKLKEKYSQAYLPEFLLSDGTISIAALIVALFFEEKPFIIIEEPERHIHPYLISKLMSLLKDASRHKQIIITTQNPEIVKHAELEDLLLINRDKAGFSTVSRPAERERVKRFLEHDLGMDTLYVMNLLEV